MKRFEIRFTMTSLLLLLAALTPLSAQEARIISNFCDNWKFYLGDDANAKEKSFDDSQWRTLNLPHDWSIEGEFSNDYPATPGGGALPGGIGWYRKRFTVPESYKDKLVFIDFDGVYRNSEVWINGRYLGKRPYGYISFRYELTPYLSYGDEENIIAVRVDNSLQPNSRWYSGSGIYRSVWLTVTDNLFVDHWGTYVTTPGVSRQSATVHINTMIRNTSVHDRQFTLTTTIYNAEGEAVDSVSSDGLITKKSILEVDQDITVTKPSLWSVENPSLYRAASRIEWEAALYDDYETAFGIRYFSFDRNRGFMLNGKKVKIKGVCNHHDLGCLGAAVNTRALERQLEILKEMGCNGIRTSHNPPAPELLDLCDRMGFIVMDEAFDMWKIKKTSYDYHMSWDEWYKRDLEDMVLRDRNHPSVFIWSIGNEIQEQWDSTGTEMARELAAIVRNIDNTRPITSACNFTDPSNYIIKSGALDLIGYNYHEKEFTSFRSRFPGQKFIAAETTSAIATRGHYDMPSDSIRVWPVRWDIPIKGNPDFTCSSYDNCHVGWGSTHEATWKIIREYDYLTGLYIWTGFDYLGEPTPYTWPARSSYFGIIDLAGFPKDAYYMYRSQWTDKPVLHVFPHWNWEKGDTIDVWVYTNCSEVKLSLNNKSLGTKKMMPDDLHLVWKVPYAPGKLSAAGKTKNKEIITKDIKTAGAPSKIMLETDRDTISADGRDMAFVTVKITDDNGTLVPYASNLVSFKIKGAGFIAGVDNGLQTSHEPFKANYRKAFNGMCLTVIQSDKNTGEIVLKAISEGLQPASVIIQAK
jgi:beta-galactosidase